MLADTDARRTNADARRTNADARPYLDVAARNCWMVNFPLVGPSLLQS